MQLRERTFGELFSLIFSLALAHLPKLVVILGVFSLPSLVFTFTYGFGAGLGEPDLEPVDLAMDLAMVGINLLGLLLMMVASALGQGACMLLVAGSFTGRTATIGECFGAAFRRLLPLVGFSLLLGLVLGVGFMMCLVPGMIFFAMFTLGVPAIMVEGRSATAAMARSRELTSGHRWSVFGLYFLLYSITGLLYVVVMLVVMVPFAMDEGSAAIPAVTLWIVQVAMMTVTVVFPVVYYFHLRVVKEGFDVEQLSSLVDEIGQRGRVR